MYQDYEEAQKYYQMVIVEAPTSAPAYYGLAVCSEKIKDTAQAVHYYERAVELGIAESSCYYNLGKLYLKMNRFPEAEKSLRNALLHDMNSRAYWILLSEVYLKMGEFKKSATCTHMADELYSVHRSPFALDTKEIESILNDSTSAIKVIFDDRPGSDTPKTAVDKLPEDLKFDKPPVLTSPITLNYPEIAVRAGVEGSVWVKILVDRDGTVKKALISKSDAEIFNNSAIECALKSQFTPATLNNIPVAAWTVIEYPFKLKH
jgi:TonB family protein